MDYKYVIEVLSNEKCFVFSREDIAMQWSIFFIRGTGYFAKIRRIKIYVPSKSSYCEAGFSIEWFFKVKKRKQRKEAGALTLEHILESGLVSDRAKTALLFNLDIFNAQ